jgi:glycosyltransferase involved in cell wall biosynthesis
MIKGQTYKNIIEWIIVEGSKSDEDALVNSSNINAWKDTLDMKCSVKYLEKKSGEKLGALRNRGNKACSGEITVVMDDDDYYPDLRVEHSVEKLLGSPNLIAGCSAMLIYDYTLDTLCKFKGFGPNHSVNNCFAWKKKYLEKYSHDESKDMGEEPSFTNKFTEPMVQLDSEKTVIQSSHSSNTFNKRELLTGGITKINPSIVEIQATITDYIKEPFFSRLRSLFLRETESKYDIIYFAGGFSMKWEPTSKSLIGSEEAIVQLSTQWAKLGKKVAVYGTMSEMRHNGVDYIDWKKFPFDEHHNIVILWKIYGILSGGPFPIKAKHIWWDLHDGVSMKQGLESWFRYGKKITKVFFKSSYHKDLFEKNTRSKLEPGRYAIIANGIRIQEFSENKQSVQRNPYRFSYISCYTRGLLPILQYLWPIIYRAEPRAELHVYGGMDYVEDKDFKNTITTLLGSP